MSKKAQPQSLYKLEANPIFTGVQLASNIDFSKWPNNRLKLKWKRAKQPPKHFHKIKFKNAKEREQFQDWLLELVRGEWGQTTPSIVEWFRNREKGYYL